MVVFLGDFFWERVMEGEEVEGVKMFKPVEVIIFIEFMWSEVVVTFLEELKV